MFNRQAAATAAACFFSVWNPAAPIWPRPRTALFFLKTRAAHPPLSLLFRSPALSIPDSTDLTDGPK